MSIHISNAIDINFTTFYDFLHNKCHNFFNLIIFIIINRIDYKRYRKVISWSHQNEHNVIFMLIWHVYKKIYFFLSLIFWNAEANSNSRIIISLSWWRHGNKKKNFYLIKGRWEKLISWIFLLLPILVSLSFLGVLSVNDEGFLLSGCLLLLQFNSLDGEMIDKVITMGWNASLGWLRKGKNVKLSWRGTAESEEKYGSYFIFSRIEF